MFSNLLRLIKIIWEHGGTLKLWAVATGIGAFSSQIDEWTGFKVGSLLPEWFPNPAWWWGLVILSLWVIYSLASRVLHYESPRLDIKVIPDNRDKSWWLEIRNVGGRTLENCAVDFERIENGSGGRVFPFSVGLLRPGGKSNPFPLRATQSKQGQFATIKDGKIVFYGMSIERKPLEVELVEEKYIFTIGAYSEAEGAQCKKSFTLQRDHEGLHII